jgi:type IV secretory pathway TrbF-like protein
MTTPPGGLNGLHITAHTGRQDRINRIEEARRARSNTLAQAFKDKARWQGMALGLLSTTILSTGAAVWLAVSGVRVEPYVVRVDRLGQEQVLSAIQTTPLKPEQSVIHGVVLAWVENVRSISNDVIVFAQNGDRVADYTTTAGLRQLTAFRREQAIRQQMGRRVQVSVSNFLPIGGQSNSYTVEWREEVYDQSGQLLVDESGLWKATVRIADFQSKTAQEEVDLRRKKQNFRNILGVFIDEVSWTMRPLPEGK